MGQNLLLKMGECKVDSAQTYSCQGFSEIFSLLFFLEGASDVKQKCYFRREVTNCENKSKRRELKSRAAYASPAF